MAVRVLVVDDTVLFRRVVSDALAAIPGVEIVGTASNGRHAIAKVETLAPDLITLDIEMPEMDGLEVLEALKARNCRIPVIVLSALTVRGGQLTLKALERGAFDFITKPTGGSPAENQAAITSALAPLVRTIAGRLEIREILKGRLPASGAAPPVWKPVSTLPLSTTIGAASTIADRMSRLVRGPKPVMALIGISTGGPVALTTVVPRLPGTLPVPVLIVQHMPPLFTQALATSLAGKSIVRVKEAENGERAVAGSVYIAPGGRHMKVQSGPEGEVVIRITDEPPENNCRPAVDTLFRSVSVHFPGKAAAAIMTGMGADGTLGLRLLKRAGCHVIAQDEGSCVVFGMPREAINAGVVDVIAPLDRIADELIKAVGGAGI